MATGRPRTVVTGLGILASGGTGREAFWQALQAGRGSIVPITLFDPAGLPVRIAGEIPDFDAKGYLDKKDRKSLKMMARSIQMGVAASNLALQDSKLDLTKEEPTRIGIDFGASLIASELEELAPAAHAAENGQPGTLDIHKWGTQGLPAMPPLWLLKYLPNMPACHVSILHNLQGPSNTVTENDVAPLLAIAEAQRVIQRGLADVMLSGGSESKVNPLSLTRMSLFSRLSKRNEEPGKAVRPFDKHRDGFVPGEGAGVLILEELEHAQKREATIYGELVGCGAAFDLKRNGDGVARAITAALKQAEVTPEQLDHVNAHGISTVDDDIAEAAGIRKAFGNTVPPVFAAKGYFGSMGAAGGAVELAVSLLALQNRYLPPTLNYETPDERCPLPVHAGAPRPTTKDYALKISFTDLGQCAAAVVKRWSE